MAFNPIDRAILLLQIAIAKHCLLSKPIAFSQSVETH